MRVAVLGLGEAGTIYADGLAAAGWLVAGFDPAEVPTPAATARFKSVAEAVAEADLVISLTGGTHAAAAATEAAPVMKEGSCYADFNSASAQLKRDLASSMAETGVRFADVAVIGSVPANGAAAPVLVSGDGASQVAEALAGVGAQVELVEGGAGAAAQRKLLRSLFMKGLGAIIVEAMTAADALSETEWMRSQIAGAITGGASSVERLASGTTKHGQRRGTEMLAAAAMLRELNLTPTMTLAAADLHQGLARDAGRLDDELLAAYENLQTAIIGDARQRQGMVDGGIQPMWGSSLFRVGGLG